MGRKQTSSSKGAPTGLILHIGAGRCSELPDYLAENPRRVLLIEPQKDRARSLAGQAREHAEVEVMPAAVDGAGNSNGRLNVFNLRDYCSLRAPTGLHDSFPGLRKLREVDVETVDISDLVARESLSPDESHRLVIDAPGEEADIVAVLATAGLLTAFQQIDLHCGIARLYEGGESSSEVLERLSAYGYEVQANKSEVDADRPHVITRLSPIKRENMALQEKVEELVEEHDRIKNELAQAAKDRDEARTALKETEAKLNKVEELAGEHDRVKNELAQAEKDRDEARTALEETEAKLKKVTESRDDLQARENERNRQLAERQQELQRIQADDAERREREERMQEEIARAEAQIDLIKELVLREEGT